MKTQQNKPKPVDLTKKFNGELEESLFRIENVLNYYNNNEDQDILKKEPENAKYVCNFCDFYFKLRGNLQEKYGFDYGTYEKKWEPDESGEFRETFYLPENKTGINVDSKLLKKDSELHKSVVDMIKKIGGRN
jgi:hypothetical protein